MYLTLNFGGSLEFIAVFSCKGEEFGYAALDSVCVRFKVPLESASVDLTLVQEKGDDKVGYGKQYLNFVQEDYKVIWWKFNTVDAKEWTNVLAIIELLFCLPMVGLKECSHSSN